VRDALTDENLADELGKVCDITARTEAEMVKQRFALGNGKIAIDYISKMVMYFPAIQLLLPSCHGKNSTPVR